MVAVEDTSTTGGSALTAVEARCVRLALRLWRFWLIVDRATGASRTWKRLRASRACTRTEG